MQVHVENGLVTVHVGSVHLSVPTQQVGDLARALGAAWVLIGGDGGSDAAGVVTARMVGNTRSQAVPAPAPAGSSGLAAPALPASSASAASAPATDAPRRRGRPPGSGLRTGASAVATASARPDEGTASPARGKRRSRKRVGEALAAWFLKHPGWYTEAELLDTVVREKMSDADPHRALKIALGKQRDIFSQDEAGRWTLANGAAPEAAPKLKGRAASAVGAGNVGEVAPKRGPGRPKGSGRKAVALSEIGPGPSSAEPPAQKRGPGRPKGSGLKRAAAAPVVEVTKPIRVKRGQSRDEVLPRGRKAAPELDVDRIRRNLFSEPAS
jgi:hypothetical protein